MKPQFSRESRIRFGGPVLAICLLATVTTTVLMAPGAAAFAAAPSITPALTPEPGLLAGQVKSSKAPLASAKVYAYQMADLTLNKVVTDTEGNFFFRELPSGLYKIIAHKVGFLPAVVMLPRHSQDVDQYLDLQLRAETRLEDATAADFWTLRKQIPTDVLRDMGLLAPVALAEPGGAPSGSSLADAPALPASHSLISASRIVPAEVATFSTELQALTGIDSTLSSESTRVAAGRVDVDGRFGTTTVGVEGTFKELESAQDASATEGITRGRQSAVAVHLTGNESSFDLRSRNNTMIATTGGVSRPVDFENYQVSWSTEIGDAGRSQISAGYTEESNFYSTAAMLAPTEIPDASRTLHIAGSYHQDFGSRSSFETEVRYRERQGQYAGLEGLGSLGLFEDESIELSGQGGYRLRPKVLVEYGLYTKMRDGSLALTPRGGMVWQLTPHWQASTEVAQRVVDREETPFRDFIPSLYHRTGGCDQSEESCYRLAFDREGEGGERLSLSAMHREVGETLRLYFNEDFFNQLESLFLVTGDELPEVQMVATRRITPTILATLESNYASGGGGVFYAAEEPFENEVRYLVTSLDTQFQGTSTGLFLAFHHLQQQLHSLEPGTTSTLSNRELEIDRLQLMLTQDLNILTNLAADWAVHLNMELTRGSSLYDEEANTDELRKSFVGGLAVRF